MKKETDDEILPVFAQHHWALKLFLELTKEIRFAVISGNYLYLKGALSRWQLYKELEGAFASIEF